MRPRDCIILAFAHVIIVFLVFEGSLLNLAIRKEGIDDFEMIYINE